jgi:hypothetical protein
MNEIVVITSMNKEGWDKYGQRFVHTFLKYWPENISLQIYAEGFHLEQSIYRVNIVSFEAHLSHLLQTFSDQQNLLLQKIGQVPTNNYLFDAMKFAKKGFALIDGIEKNIGKQVIWLDADIYTFFPISNHQLSKFLQSDNEEVFCSHLRRFGMHTESGFLSFSTLHPLTNEFCERYKSIYLSGAIFHLEHWTDCHVFDCLKTYYISFGFQNAFYEIPALPSTHPFINSPLGLFMDHLKGNRKNDGTSSISDYIIPPRSRVKFDGRYTQIPKLIELFKPSSIVEIGTWSGWRAIQMSLYAFQHQRAVTYAGFDVFSTGSKELDELEKNIKPHFPQDQVGLLLEFLKIVEPNFNFHLISGDTNETLKSTTADFAFIDGGHAVETIRNDFDNLRMSKIILLDNFYDGAIDTNLYGCNQVIEDLPHYILPIADPVTGGGTTQFVVVANSEDLNIIRRAFEN